MSAIKTSTGRLSAEKTLALWREYRLSGDPALRDRLILTFAPMVKYIVYRKVREIPSRCDIEDFISCGLEALIRSVDRFDPDKGCSLEQFAWTRIHGAVLDELRRGDWAPRSVRRWERDINRARDQFTGLYGRPPSREELWLEVQRENQAAAQAAGQVSMPEVTVRLKENAPASSSSDELAT